MKTHEEIEAKITYMLLNESRKAEILKDPKYSYAHSYAFTVLSVLREWLLEGEENAPNQSL